MKKQVFEWADISMVAQLSIYENPGGGAREYHAMIKVNDCFLDAKTQFSNIDTAMERIIHEFKGISLIFKRYFVSDAINQSEFLKDDSCAVSIVGQTPANGTKVALWAYFTENCKTHRDTDGTFAMERPHYKHLYNTQMFAPLADEIQETRTVFDDYIKSLTKQNCSLADNCIRTWIFVQGIDLHYAGMVAERKKLFEEQGLTSETHYIASTGIEGRYLNAKSLVFMDAYSVKGILPEQISYIKAVTHLSPTYEYGVTFERATSVDYGDRRHVFVSGTASINNRGEILYPEDVIRQTDRVFENIEALLDQAETGMDDLAQMTVYLRDIADYSAVAKYFDDHEIEIPYLIVQAPVCRPGWLIEIEGIAIKTIKNGDFEKF